MTGYQQAILHLLGVKAGGRFLVRCIDRWYIDAVADLFPTTPYCQSHSVPGKKDYWVLKSAKVDYRLSLADVTDWRGFCRGVIELQGVLDHSKRHNRNGTATTAPRLRIYGTTDLLAAIMSHLPARPKAIQSVQTHTGATSAVYYQSPAEISDILSYISGQPANQKIIDDWHKIINDKQP